MIAEQDNFTNYGRQHLENGVLKFIYSTEKYEDYGKFDIALMSASLQYIPSYKEIISKVMKAKPNYIILDRILVSDKRRICRETVPEVIYKSSYPVMIYSENEILNFFGTEYEIIERDVSSVPERVHFEDGKAESRLFVFQHKGGKT